ncbi:MAG: succinate dehydrogenase assembly factor 4 [Thermomonas sp.]
MIGQSDPSAEPGQSPLPNTEAPAPSVPDAIPAAEVGGREGPDPTRYGDWEKNGRCIDF